MNTPFAERFKNAPNAPVNAKTDLAPDTPDLIIDFVDMFYEVDALNGYSYPFDGPSPCQEP